MRKPLPASSWHGQLLMFSSTLFFISLAVFLGLKYGYRPYLDSQVKKLDDQIQSFAQETPVDKQEEIIKFYSQLANLKTILKNHFLTSQALTWLEKNTSQDIYYTKFGLNSLNHQISLSGAARGVPEVAQELQVFSSLPEVTRVGFNNLTLGPGGLWQFDMNLVFNPKSFSSASGESAPENQANPRS